MSAVSETAAGAKLTDVRTTRTGLLLAEVTDTEGERALIKMTRERHPAVNLRRQWRLLRLLWYHPDLKALTSFIPRPMLVGTLEGWTYLAESRLPGRPATDVSQNHGGELDDSLMASAASLIDVLHRGTRRETVVDDRLLERWVGRRVSAVVELLREQYPSGNDRVLELGETLCGALRGQTVATSWIHGDYWPGNLLLGRDGTIVGVVDWDSLRGNELALHDFVHFSVTTRRLRERHPWGWVLGQLIRGGADDAATRAELLEGDHFPRGLRVNQALTLYWLLGVSSNLARHPETTRSRRWINDNIVTVLRSVA